MSNYRRRLYRAAATDRAGRTAAAAALVKELRGPMSITADVFIAPPQPIVLAVPAAAAAPILYKS
ncbi:hypothetical protein [Mycobacterium tuberculosis]|uniref:hypothetical protein n=1 Tax=Mycobacterium tuberculosis TaxID=1773 RepID=UPI00272ADEBD|nr:hypothetical protein [Mycobacterium tuberculosis]